MDSQPRSLLVSGASGFIGGHLVRRLLSEGRRVTALLRSPAEADLPDAVDRLAWPTDQAHLRDLVAGCGAEACLHLAAHFVAEHGPGDVVPLVESNIARTAALGDACAAAGLRRLVFTGTVWQNASGPDYDPVSLYAATKQAAQDLLLHFSRSGLPVVVLRIPDTYGPGDTRRKVLDLLVDAAATGETLSMSGGEQIVDLVHVDDVVEALVQVLDNPDLQPWEEFALSSGRPVTLRELAAVVGEALGAAVPVSWGERPYRRREAFQPWEAGPPVPDWSPAVRLEDGVRSLWHHP